ncbi:MAG TPA: glutamate-1-semialdehyde 2,1-aminomutase [Flavisolibacter sp.]|nr:glutamate-1-semialdehyde 2,1-aminomutase [Flavisolibacter sp.]
MKIIAITQARYGSSRLPGKVLKKVNGKALLTIHLERALKASRIDKLIVATTVEPEAEAIAQLATGLGCGVYRGSIDDVLDRFYGAARPEDPDLVVRITSDCPLIDPELIDQVIDTCIGGGYDYCSNTIDPAFPDGMDVEVFRFSALEKAWKEASLRSDREHVTPYIWRNSTEKGGTLFKSFNYKGPGDYSRFRLTVDEASDFELINQLILKVGDTKSWMEYVSYLEIQQELFETNAHIKRNQGLMKSVEQDKIMLREISNFQQSEQYRKKIHDLIPGGAHTYSKGDDQFPERAPAAIEYGKGAHVWDIDGNKFLDCSMGLTSVVLGHGYEPVVNRVKAELEKGVNFQRPSYLEMEMAEKFLSLVPQHQMIKFAKNGSIVTTAAVKLARAFTGRKLVAFPFDHPFYSYDDWFIGKTACNLGVPEEISALSVTYKADDLESLNALFEKYPGQIACVISEPEKNWGLPEGYLRKAIALTHQHGALYIQDEMITGFKTDFPGSIKKYDVSPDMATWGKGIANGFSFCALTGKKEVMELGGIRNKGAEKVFLISTTHGGETHTIAAALATIETFQRQDVIGHNQGIGKYFNQLCAQVIASHGLADHVELAPCDWMPIFVFRNRELEISAGLRTLAMQEMIKRGVLFQGAFVPCFSHTKNDIEYFAEAFDQTASVLKQALDAGFEKFLIGEPAKAVFRKYL